MDAKTTGIVSIYYMDWFNFGAGARGSGRSQIAILNQALVIWLAGFLGVIPCVGWIWGIFCFICAVMGFIAAINGEEKEVPLLGKIKLLK